MSGQTTHLALMQRDVLDRLRLALEHNHGVGVALLQQSQMAPPRVHTLTVGCRDLLEIPANGGETLVERSEVR